ALQKAQHVDLGAARLFDLQARSDGLPGVSQRRTQPKARFVEVVEVDLSSGFLSLEFGQFLLGRSKGGLVSFAAQRGADAFVAQMAFTQQRAQPGEASRNAEGLPDTGQAELDLAWFFEGDGAGLVLLLGIERARSSRAWLVGEPLCVSFVPVVEPAADRVAVDLEDV